MLDLTQLFGGKRKPKQLIEYGFSKKGNGYFYAESILDGQFEVRISVTDKVTCEVWDTAFEEQYFLHLVEDAEGGFVGEVRSEYERIVLDISKKCFAKALPFKGDVMEKVLAYCKKTYSTTPDCPFKKDEALVLRRRDNKKWYGLIMKIPRSKIGLDGDEEIQVINMMAPREELSRLIDKKNYFPAYHMNKKTWLTVPLDGRVSYEIICWLLDISYKLASGKKNQF